MKSGILIIALLLSAVIPVSAQNALLKKDKLTPSRGHYHTLATYSPAPQKGMEKIDALRFELGSTNAEVFS